jgi:hypothetical protein
MTRFRDWIAEFSNKALSGEAAQRFAVGIWGSLLDSSSEAMEQALYLPSLAMGDGKAEDVLALLGTERRMPRFPHESASSYRLRLMNAWEAWRYAGTSTVVLQQLDAMGLSAEIREPVDWDWDGNAADWSRFWVVIKPPHPWVRAYRYGAPPTGDGKHFHDPLVTYGSNMTIYEVLALRGLVRQWKPGHVRCQYIIVVFDQAAWDLQQPDGTWNVHSHRNPAAMYIPG